MIISNDHQLIQSIEVLMIKIECDLTIFNTSNDPLDVISEIASRTINILMFDDDYLELKTIKLLETVKKISPKLPVIFITSNTSIELGRKINSIGVKYYLMKPVTEENLGEFIKSVKLQNEEKGK